MNINDIFDRKVSKKERKERRMRELERMRNKAVIAGSILDRKSKLKVAKSYENSPGFQKDLWRMKQMLVKKDYNVFKKNPEFMKSKTQMELKGFDKQFKKRKDFMRL